MRLGRRGEKFRGPFWPGSRNRATKCQQATYLEQRFWNFSKHHNHLENLLDQIVGPQPQSFWFSRSGVGPVIYSQKLPGDDDPGTQPETLWTRQAAWNFRGLCSELFTGTPSFPSAQLDKSIRQQEGFEEMHLQRSSCDHTRGEVSWFAMVLPSQRACPLRPAPNAMPQREVWLGRHSRESLLKSSRSL